MFAARAFGATRRVFSEQVATQTNPAQASLEVLKVLAQSRKSHINRIKASKTHNKTFDFIATQLQAQRRAVRSVTRLPYPELAALTPSQRQMTLADYYKRNRAFQKKFPSEVTPLTALAQVTGSRSAPVLKAVPAKKEAYIVPDNSPYKYKSLIGTPRDEIVRDAKFWTTQPHFYQRFYLLISVGFVAGFASSTFGIEF